MAIMVVLAFLSLFTTQYMPVAMREMEAGHMNEARTQFMLLRQTIDNQILTDQRSMTLYSPITLGSEGIPVFTAPSFGELSFKPQESEMSVEFVSNVGDVSESGSGRLSLYVPNRYYIPQTLVFENGAIITYQKAGQRMNVNPHLNFFKVGGSRNLTLTLLDFIGTGSAITDYGTTGVQSQLEYTVSEAFTGISSPIYINITTEYTSAWGDFFNETLEENLGAPGTLQNWTVSIGNKVVSVVIKASNLSIDCVEVSRAILHISIGNEV